MNSKVLHTMTSEVEESREFTELASSVSRVGKLSVGVTKLVEEGVNHGINCRLSLGGGVLEQASNEVNSVGVRLSEDFIEGMRLNLRELVLHIVGVHCSNLFPSRCTQNFDDLDELVDTRLAREKRLAKHELGHHTSS
jgi:hypothetical protein